MTLNLFSKSIDTMKNEKFEFFKKFRGVDLINREKEIKYFLEYFSQRPENVLLVYGPINSGKTNLIEYIIENYLFKDKSLNTQYINFRGKMVSHYDNFIESFVKSESLVKDFKEIRHHFIKINSKLYERLKNKEIDFFDAIEKEFSSNNKKNIIIIDTIEMLRYIEDDETNMDLLHKFLTFCVALTWKHISHVVILTSDTLFLEKFYKKTLLREASKFKLIDYLSYEDVKKRLEAEGFNENEINLVYEYLGGDAADIKDIIIEHKKNRPLKEFLEEKAKIAGNFIRGFIALRKISKEEEESFFYVIEKIVKDGEFDNNKHKGYMEKVVKFIEGGFLFYDLVSNKIYANSPIYVKAFELLLKDN